MNHTYLDLVIIGEFRHRYSLEDLLFKTIIKRRGNEIYLLKNVDNVLAACIQKIFMRLRDYVPKNEWHLHRVIFCVAARELTSGIQGAYYTLDTDVNDIINVLNSYLNAFLQSWKGLQLDNSFHLSCQVYSKNHTKKDQGNGIFQNGSDDDDASDGFEDDDDDDEMVGGNPEVKGHTKLLKIEPSNSWGILTYHPSKSRKGARLNRIWGDRNQIKQRCLVLAFILAYFFQTHKNPHYKNLMHIQSPRVKERNKSLGYLHRMYQDVCEELDLRRTPNKLGHPLRATIKKLVEKWDCQVFVLKAHSNYPIYWAHPTIIVDISKVHIFLYHDDDEE